MSHPRTVRLARRSSALTQDELADLLAITQTTISRLEDKNESTTLETALGLQVIFDTEPRSFFAKLYERVEEAVMTRAADLDVKIRDKYDSKSRKKQALLNIMVKRATAQNKAL